MTAPTTPTDAPTTVGRPPRWAPLADAAVLMVFVGIGRRTHGLETTGVTWFLTVLWPLAVAWVVGSLALSLYTARTREFVRLVGTIVITALLGGLLRHFTPGHSMFSAFNVVLSCGLLLGMGGWRVVLRVVRR